MATYVPLTPGQVFARDYRVLRPLAQGGMGSVYVVEQLSTSEKRALKTLHPQFATDPRTLQRFDQEARVAAQIPSAHVVKIVQAGVDDATGMPWLCMELLSGETLSESVARGGAIAPATVATLFEQLGHALELAHRIPLVHRDIKPENVFLAAAQTPGVPFTAKLLDFGIAKLAQAQGTTQAVGSPLWMAPEQLGNAPVSPATDVWALGLLAFHALTGRYYWRSASESVPVASVIFEIVSGDRPPASHRAAEMGCPPLPAGFDAWFARCLAQDPAERFPHAGAARDALLAVLSAAGPMRVSGPQPAAAFEATGYLPATPAPGSLPGPPRAQASGSANAYASGNLPAPMYNPGTPPPGQFGATGATRSGASAGASGGAAGLVIAGALALAAMLAGGFAVVRRRVAARERMAARARATERVVSETAGPAVPGAVAATTGGGESCESLRTCPDPLHQICTTGLSPHCEASPAGARIRLSYDGLPDRWVGAARYVRVDFHPDPARDTSISFGFSERLTAGVGQITVYIPRNPSARSYRVGTHPGLGVSFVSVAENLAPPGRYQGRFDSVDGTLVLTDVSYEFGGHVAGQLHVQLQGGNVQPPLGGELTMDFSADLPR